MRGFARQLLWLSLEQRSRMLKWHAARPPSPQQTFARAPEGGHGEGGSRSQRFMRFAAGEVGELRPAFRLAQGLGGILPQFCFNQLRTALWRAAKVQIGQGSLLMGE